ncbi:hypothetical protein CTI12_AA159360 [Artemisia annua]|uniref:DUF659 domain-containing protein n=1 Tax=Artemisia annua TaxID=35608 RepID=A0A2U1PFF3_ARTAN|nr:hypothetical protein CTI12_AA159360 [Artemisia annua]
MKLDRCLNEQTLTCLPVSTGFFSTYEYVLQFLYAEELLIGCESSNANPKQCRGIAVSNDSLQFPECNNNASEKRKEEKDNKPLLQEVTLQAPKHEYTFIFLDHEKYHKVFNKVKEAENVGVSKSSKTYVILKKPSCSKKPIEESFGIMERSMVDLKIMRGLCENGIPLNVLRNPHFQEMVSAINKAPDGYKPPYSEKARTALPDECLRDVEKDLTPIKDTWYSQGVSIVCDGWSNVKHNPLINVLAVHVHAC